LPEAGPATPEEAVFPADASATVSMPRVTLATYLDGLDPWPESLSDRVCRSADDLIFASIDDGRPELVGPRGDFTWLATVQRHETHYSVSVAVFHRRDLTGLASTEPPERATLCQVIGGGIGGGDVRLVAFQDDHPRAWLDLQKGGWLMLCSSDAFRWYRVVALDETQETSEDVDGDGTIDDIWSRYVTLAGPDWGNGDCQAAIVDNVVGVYRTVICD
ncbi:unnamed protein product, partial [marine sediment metagenome]